MFAMNYTRKRALLACDFCRHRKRKCDGGRPCSTCVESNADCVYKELPSDRVESSSPGAVLERLERIETLLQTQGLRLDSIAQSVGLPRGSSTQGNPSFHSLQPQLLTLSPSDASLQTTGTTSSPLLPNESQTMLDTHLDSTQFLIPFDHTASPGWLLSCASVRSILGNYQRDYFYTLEECLPLPQPLHELPGPLHHWPSLDAVTLEQLARNYFSAAHPHFPLFTVHEFEGWQAELFQAGPINTIETAICLCVYAIGSLVCQDGEGNSDSRQAGKDALGMKFFRPALSISLRHAVWGFRPEMNVVRAVLLCASYLAHMGRPLHSWKLAYYTSINFIQLLDNHRRKRDGLFSADDDDYLRAFWSCFMIECDRVAEVDVLRSGIEPMAEKMPLPRSRFVSESDDLIYFVAEVAIRRLLNRILSSLYDAHNSVLLFPTAQSPAFNNKRLNKYLSLSSELDRQLEQWYRQIPENFRPPLGAEDIASDRGKVLRMQYYSAKQLIHRQSVFYVALQQSPSTSRGSRPGTPQPGPQSSRTVLEKCETCVTACSIYLRNALDMLDKRSPYLWTFSQGALACMLVLTVAETSPQLRTPNLEVIQTRLAAKLQRWAVAGSSFEAIVKILEDMDSMMET